ncbi:MAG: HlyD family efflux transporter periplasmic adaptor subunit [Bacteroidia bacterium]
MKTSKASIVRNKITISEKEKQILELQFEHNEAIRKSRDQIEQSIRHIENYINNWKQSYIIKAPISGRISFLKPLPDKQYVKSDEELFAVVPNDQHYLGLVQIPVDGFGKVQTGQKVLIRLNKYPSAEYGQIEGTIDELSLMPNQEQYRAVVTARGPENQLPAAAEILPGDAGHGPWVTEDLRLSERILYRFRGMLDRSQEQIPQAWKNDPNQKAT